MRKTLVFDVGTIIFEFTTCCQCQMPVALPADRLAHFKTGAGSFWCPLCGSEQGWSYLKENEEKRLKAENEQLRKNLKWEENYAKEQRELREAREKQLAATKGVVTRLKNRAAKGICPCCNRSFENLRRHMETKHPGFADEPS